MANNFKNKNTTSSRGKGNFKKTETGQPLKDASFKRNNDTKEAGKKFVSKDIKTFKSSEGTKAPSRKNTERPDFDNKKMHESFEANTSLQKSNPIEKGKRPYKKEQAKEETKSGTFKSFRNNKDKFTSKTSYSEKKQDSRKEKNGFEERDSRSGKTKEIWDNAEGKRPNPSKAYSSGNNVKPATPKRRIDFKKDKKEYKERSSINKKEGVSGEKRKTENFRKDNRHSKDISKELPKPGVQGAWKDGKMRLNKFISNSGVCSRRDADTLIQDGLIKVNGEVITELGYQVSRGDKVKYGNKILNPERLVYILLNKPKDFITTMEDPEERKTVMHLVKNACEERVYPVGRLDRNTTGLLLLTNDGEIASTLTHPKHEVSKIYQVDLDKPITDEDFQKIVEGVVLEDGPVTVDDIEIISPDKRVIGLQIHEGRNRIVRRLFEHLGYEVVNLDRAMYAGLNKKDLPRGKWRMLTPKEVLMLKRFK